MEELITLTQGEYFQLKNNYLMLLQITKRTAESSCCYCCDRCLACDALEVFNNTGEQKWKE